MLTVTIRRCPACGGPLVANYEQVGPHDPYTARVVSCLWCAREAPPPEPPDAA